MEEQRTSEPTRINIAAYPMVFTDILTGAYGMMVPTCDACVYYTVNFAGRFPELRGEKDECRTCFCQNKKFI